MKRDTPVPSIETHPYRVGSRYFKRLHNAVKASNESTKGGASGCQEVFRRIAPRDPSSYFSQDRQEGRELAHVPVTARAEVIENNIDGYWRANQGGTYGDGCSWSSTPHILEREIPHYSQRGTFVIDKRAALERDPSLAFKAPLYRYGMKGFDRFAERYPGLRETLASMEPGLDGMFATLARMSLIDSRSVSFDECGAEEYAAWWAAHGATVKVTP